MATEKQKMLAGELYAATGEELRPMHDAPRSGWTATTPRSPAPSEITRRCCASCSPQVGEGADIRPPFHCDYGYNISLGGGVFLNFNCVILDVVKVTIGDGTQIGPGVQILTADHPRDPAQRAQPGVRPARHHRPQCLDRRRGDRSCRASPSATMRSSVPAPW